MLKGPLNSPYLNRNSIQMDWNKKCSDILGHMGNLKIHSLLKGPMST